MLVKCRRHSGKQVDRKRPVCPRASPGFVCQRVLHPRCTHRENVLFLSGFVRGFPNSDCHKHYVLETNFDKSPLTGIASHATLVLKTNDPANRARQSAGQICKTHRNQHPIAHLEIKVPLDQSEQMRGQVSLSAALAHFPPDIDPFSNCGHSAWCYTAFNHPENLFPARHPAHALD